MTSKIPQPRSWPVIGNLLEIDAVNFTQSACRFADKYGEIYKLNVLGQESYIVSSAELVEELCDESRFEKKIDDALNEMRHAVGAGLFTARNDEPDWASAHRTLMPAFGPLPIKDMFEEMYDVASRLVEKWARNGPEQSIAVTDDMTRLTLDSIALCAMDMRFNSFYRDELHEFVQAMVDTLTEAGRRTVRAKLEAVLNPAAEKKFFADIALLKNTAQECIDRRKAGPRKKDLLDLMLNGKDPRTGQPLSEEVIMNNIITFLVAGHETTSGLLSFTIYYLLKSPEALQRAQQEVDDVIGCDKIEHQHLSKLPFLEATLRESLRLSPTAPSFTVGSIKEESVVLGGKYVLPRNALLSALLPKSQTDSKVFGEDANEFRPERMLGDQFRNLKGGAWKPFGNGARGCIGRPFAWQEAVLALALILQNFNLRLNDPSYELKIAESLTIKPADLFIEARLRSDADPIDLLKRLHGGSAASTAKRDSVTGASVSNTTSPPTSGPMTILYGSSSGTCEGLAQSLASAARARGFSVSTLPLDAGVDRVPRDHPWLKSVGEAKVSGARFALFGCGHRDWVSTYQKVPRTIQQELCSKGATAIVARGETDVSQSTIFDDFDAWTDTLMTAISATDDQSTPGQTFDVKLSTASRASHLHYKLKDARVLSNDRITHPDAAEKRHVTLRLPTDSKFDTGDYLAVLPLNSEHMVSRVLRRFSLPWDTSMTITSGCHATIPTEQQLPVSLVLGGYIELSTTATRKSEDIISQHAKKPLINETGSVIDILERYPDIAIPFSTFLAMHHPLRLRQYSISSSPLADTSTASITFSVIDNENHKGTATSYLKSLEPGSTLQVAVKKSSAAFRLPLDDSISIIMVAAGTGLAPFRGFLQERTIKADAGRKLGQALLFVGCRRPNHDKLFADELAEWQRKGVVKVFYAFSQASKQSKGCRYVQDRLWMERDLVGKIFDADARAYICGSSAVGKAVSDVAIKIILEQSERDGEAMTEGEARECWEKWRGERYAVDVFD
ncbi:putative Flavoprotein-like superfamily [Septoria linicola]|nr:putative Flavoprotein-like superfamily [Septoria linicola]